MINEELLPLSAIQMFNVSGLTVFYLKPSNIHATHHVHSLTVILGASVGA